MYGYNAEQPIAIPIYTVLLYCVIKYHSLHAVCRGNMCLLQGGEAGVMQCYIIVISYFLCRDFMDADMNRTKMIIGYLRPLLRLEHPQLEHFIHKSLLYYYIHVHTCQ